jgi:hypothetical protein
MRILWRTVLNSHENATVSNRREIPQRLPDDNQSRPECALGSLAATVLLSISGGTADFSMCINRVAVTSQSICIIAMLPTGGRMVSVNHSDDTKLALTVVHKIRCCYLELENSHSIQLWTGSSYLQFDINDATENTPNHTPQPNSVDITPIQLFP